MSDLKTGLRTLYTAVLNAMDVQFTEDGTAVMESVGDTLRPVVVSNDEVLVLPTDERLRSGDWAGVQPFHPLSENALRGESVVLKKLRVLAAARLTGVIQMAVQMLCEIAADTKLHAKLSPTASKFLDHATKADHKTIDKLKAVMDKVSITGDHRLLAFYFNRPGEQKKNSYTRSCRVDFPVFDEFTHKEALVFGVKMRIADKEVVKGIFEWLFDIDDVADIDTQMMFDKYGSGTTSLTVPYFTTLMNSFVKVANQLNSKLKLFKKTHGELVQAMHIDTSWADELADLSKYRDLIPPLRGNEGATTNHPGKRQEAAAPAPAPAAPTIQVKKPNLAFEPVGSAGNEEPSHVPAPAAHVVQHAPAAPAYQPAPHQSPVPQQQQQQQSGQRLISWSSVNQPAPQQQFHQGYGTPPVHSGWGAPQQVIGNMNARDMLRQQAYQQYQRMPNAFFDPSVYQQVMQQPVQPVQFQPQMPQPAIRTVPASPTPGVRMPSSWK